MPNSVSLPSGARDQHPTPEIVQRVIAEILREPRDVVARAAIDRVVAGAAGQDVVAGIAGDDIVAPALPLPSIDPAPVARVSFSRVCVEQ